MSPSDSERTTFVFPEKHPNIDVWVEETFVDHYETDRAVLAGETYGLIVGEDGNGIKQHLNWDTTHHTFDEQRSEWIVDVDGLEHLAEVAAEYDGTVATDPDDDTLCEVVEYVEEDAKIEVEYDQKNGNGLNTKTGEIRRASEDVPFIRFIRDDGQTMRVKFDEDGDISLYTGGRYPFVGTVTSLAIEE